MRRALLFFARKYWLSEIRAGWLILLIGCLTGCAAPSFSLNEKQPDSLCWLNMKEENRQGRLLLELRADWRADQKEPQKRLQIAEQVLLDLVADQQESCLGQVNSILTSDSLYQLRDGMVSRTRLNESRSGSGRASGGFQQNFDTHIVLIMEELGPHLLLSFPVLWSGYSEASLQVQVFDLKSGKKLYQDYLVRRIGGPFQLRSEEQSGSELKWLLSYLLYPSSGYNGLSGY